MSLKVGDRIVFQPLRAKEFEGAEGVIEKPHINGRWWVRHSIGGHPELTSWSEDKLELVTVSNIPEKW